MGNKRSPIGNIPIDVPPLDEIATMYPDVPHRPDESPDDARVRHYVNMQLESRARRLREALQSDLGLAQWLGSLGVSAFTVRDPRQDDGKICWEVDGPLLRVVREANPKGSWKSIRATLPRRLQRVSEVTLRKRYQLELDKEKF
jgi:hypothetical protein